MYDPTTITLGGQTYSVKPITMGQLRRVLHLRGGGNAIDFAFDFLTVALERATPKPAVPADEMIATPGEVFAAVSELLEANGLDAAEPGEATAQVTMTGDGSTAS